MLSPRSWLLTLLATVALVALSRAAGLLPEVWLGWPDDGCLNYNCYCEPIRPGFVRQTFATETNLGFAAVGLALAFGRTALGDRRRWLAVGALLLTAAGSWFYHASLTRVGEWADLMGTYGLLLLFNILAALRRWPGRGAAIGMIAIGFWALGGIQMAFARDLQQIVFVVLVGSAVTLEARTPAPGHDRRWLFAGLACFAVGAACWIGDATGRLPCWPEAPFTWHGLWHLLAAGAAGLMCRYHLGSLKSGER